MGWEGIKDREDEGRGAKGTLGVVMVPTKFGRKLTPMKDTHTHTHKTH